MNPVIDALLTSWPADPGLLAGLVVSAAVYLRGWFGLRRRDRTRWRSRQAAAFVGGLVLLFLALASPIEPFSFLFLQVHMVQHLLLMLAVPPLLWLGDPLFPMLHGLPAPVRTYWVAPLFRSRPLRRFFGWLVHPVVAWLLFVGTSWLWHLPALYELALRSDGWHYVQHLAFLGTALVFWYPVVTPYPSRPRWGRWWLIPYLFTADVQNTLFCALLTFSDRVLYPHYAQMPRLEGISALDDQAAAGVIMWVPGSLVFLVPLAWIGIGSLFGLYAGKRSRRSATATPASRFAGRLSLTVLATSPLKPTGPWDLLQVPWLGQFLRWRHARISLQLPILLVASLLLYDGLTGPPVAPVNLAGVLPWIHWRGFLIFGLLSVGNVFCLACPFLVPRTMARRFFPPRLNWPRRLRNKWLAVLLLVAFLWAYEVFALWDSPWWTAWLALGYFGGALVVDSLFKGAVFCKYVCPIGQFNFVQSLVSPWEVRARHAAVCVSCRTKDCIRGRTNQRGCELSLFVPRKASNMDCTLCLDCIHACPHDNIGILATPPAAELWHDRWRSGIGRFEKRPDLAALVLVLVFGAFANAAGMIAPVVEWQDALRQQWELSSLFWPAGVYYLLCLIVGPTLVIAGVSSLSRRWGKITPSWRETATRQVYALVPLGFAMWLAHYSFHFLTSYDAAVPAVQRFLGEFGVNLGSPDFTATCCRPAMAWLPRLEILFLDVGMLLSLYTAYRIALSSAADYRHGLKALTPWAILIVLLFALGIWILLQPMQMRGTMQMAG